MKLWIEKIDSGVYLMLGENDKCFMELVYKVVEKYYKEVSIDEVIVRFEVWKLWW